MKPLQKIVEEVDELARLIYRSMDDPETISKSLFELAILSVGLGNYLLEAQDRERALETLLKHTIDKGSLKLIEEGQPTGKAEIVSRVEAHKHKLKWLEAKKQSDVLKLKRSDIDKIIDTGRSRLSLIKSDMKG